LVDDIRAVVKSTDKVQDGMSMETKVMGSAERRQKCGLYSQLLHFHFSILTITKKIYTFFCIQEQQRAPSPPISPIRGNGDASTALIIRGNVPVSNAR
jgi:hypothetical protein